MVSNIGKKVENEQTVRRRVWRLKENNMKARFQGGVKKLVDVDAPNVWNAFKDGILKSLV